MSLFSSPIFAIQTEQVFSPVESSNICTSVSNYQGFVEKLLLDFFIPFLQARLLSIFTSLSLPLELIFKQSYHLIVTAEAFLMSFARLLYAQSLFICSSRQPFIRIYLREFCSPKTPSFRPVLFNKVSITCINIYTTVIRRRNKLCD